MSRPAHWTVGQLKAFFDTNEHISDDTAIVLSRDPEGNGFHVLADPDIGAFVEKDGEVFLLPHQLDDQMREKGYSEEDVRDPAEFGVARVVVLWP
jgi:hypothetical protein